MDTRKLEYFLAVIDNSTVTAAADAIGVTQPAVSRALRELSDELGSPLFRRSGRGLALTAAGEALEGHARRALRHMAAGRAAVAKVGEGIKGRLDMACQPTVAAQPVAALVGRFRAAHPGVMVRLAAPEDASDMTRMLLDGAVEIAIGEPQRRAGIGIVELDPDELVVILPPSHDGDPLDGGPLPSLAMVVTPLGTSSRQWLEAQYNAAGRTMTIAVETAQREAIVPLVLAGAGAAVVSRAMAANAMAMGARLWEPKPKMWRELAVMHSFELSPAGTAFVQMCTETGRTLISSAGNA